MKSSTTAIDFVPPATVYECDERMAQLSTDLTHIAGQLADPRRREDLDPRAYRIWRSNATRAQAYKAGELKRLRAWKARWDEDRRAHAAELKAQRLAAWEAKEARKDAAIERLPDEGDLILRLYVALDRLHRRLGVSPTEMDAGTMARARAYLIDAEVFTA